MPPADFKPTKRVLLVLLDVAGRGGLGSIFFLLSCGSTLGAQSGLYCSQVSNLQPKPSECSMSPTVHLCQATCL